MKSPQNNTSLSSKRITLFLGHYGSGKTNIAVNYAKMLKNEGKEVTLADLDIVNPYFRAKDSREDLEKMGISFIGPEFANTNVDLPALPAEIYGVVMRYDRYGVFDVGGDDRGALALGRYVPYIIEENDFNAYFAVNFYRPLTPDAESAFEVMREVSTACGLPITGIVNNSNLGDATTVSDIENSFSEMKKLSEISAVPLAFTSAERSLVPGVSKIFGEIFPLDLQKKIF